MRPEAEDSLRLSEIAAVNPRTRIPDLAADAPVSFIPMEDVDERAQWNKRRTRSLAEVRNGYTVFREGDVLFAKITPCTENGKGCHAVGLVNGIGFGSTEFHVLRARKGVNPRFVFHLATTPGVRARATAMMGGSAGQQRVPTDFFQVFVIPKANLQKQDDTAQLLDAVDDAIERTREVIGQTRRLKQALLQDLLTHGLPGRHQALQEIRGLGTVPQSWNILTLEKLACERPRSIQSGPFGSSLLHSEFQNEGRLVIGIDSVLDGRFSMGAEHRISEVRFQKLRKYAARALDVLVTVMASLGRCCVVPPDLEPALITKHVYRITVNQSVCDPHFLMWTLLSSPPVLRQLYGGSQGQTRDGLNGTILRNVRVPIPTLEEQRDVAAMASSIEGRVIEEEAKEQAFRNVKTALSQALLTGRVRVTV